MSRLRAAKCRIPAHSCPSYASLAFALLVFLLSQSTTKFHLKHDPKMTHFLALVKPKREKTCVRQGASSGTLRGRFRRPPLTSRGRPRVAASPRPPMHCSGPVYWHITQPVHTVLARATRAQPYFLAIVQADICSCPPWIAIRRESTREQNAVKMKARTVVGRGEEGPLRDPGSKLLLGRSARVVRG